MEIEPHKFSLVLNYKCVKSYNGSYSAKSRGFLEFATPSLHYNFNRYNFTCFKFLPSASNSIGRV